MVILDTVIADLQFRFVVRFLSPCVPGARLTGNVDVDTVGIFLNSSNQFLRQDLFCFYIAPGCLLVKLLLKEAQRLYKVSILFLLHSLRLCNHYITNQNADPPFFGIPSYNIRRNGMIFNHKFSCEKTLSGKGCFGKKFGDDFWRHCVI